MVIFFSWIARLLIVGILLLGFLWLFALAVPEVIEALEQWKNYKQ